MGFADNIKRLLKERGLTVADLSKLIDVPPTTLYSIIQRDGWPTLDIAKKICLSINCGFGELMEGDSPYGYIRNPDGRYLFYPGESDMERRLYLYFRMLNGDGQAEAMKRVSELAELEKYKKKEPAVEDSAGEDPAGKDPAGE